MNKLGKKREATFEHHKTRLADSAGELGAAIETFNAKRTALWAKVADALIEFNDETATLWSAVDDALTDHNNAVDEARDFVTEVADDVESYYDDRSERWQLSDRGGAYEEWRDAWREAAGQLEPPGDLSEPNPVELDEPDLLDEPSFTHEDLDDLATEFEF